ncbi:hypothetical protein, partial [Aeromonas caviae]|uniref:hypothetical protein n=1 Tax=Aeromonas caviae TaxID=648 RepID=UPI0028DDF4A1
YFISSKALVQDEFARAVRAPYQDSHLLENALSGQRPPYQDSHLLEKALIQRPAQFVIQYLRWHL